MGVNTSAVEALAAILIVFAIVKLTIVLVRVQAWLALVRAVYAKPMITSVVSYGLSGLVLYFLVESGMTIVQILAVCLFVTLLLVPGVAPYADGILSWVEKREARQILKTQRLYLAIWLILLGRGVYELLFR